MWIEHMTFRYHRIEVISLQSNALPTELKPQHAKLTRRSVLETWEVCGLQRGPEARVKGKYYYTGKFCVLSIMLCKKFAQ